MVRDVDLDHHRKVRSLEAAAERWLFGNRIPILAAFVLISIFLGWHAVQLRPMASFEKMVPAKHPYVA
ncbi:hypothetical protein TSO221_34235, partial [Azospirillum sp. TSO22-1]